MYFARFWIGFALNRQIRSWSFLRANDVPKYMGDSPPRYFKHVLTAVDRLNIDMTLLPDYKVRTFYEKLAHPSPRSLPCTGALERRLATPLPWPNIWSNIYSGLSTPTTSLKSGVTNHCYAKFSIRPFRSFCKL